MSRTLVDLARPTKASSIDCASSAHPFEHGSDKLWAETISVLTTLKLFIGPVQIPQERSAADEEAEGASSVQFIYPTKHGSRLCMSDPQIEHLCRPQALHADDPAYELILDDVPAGLHSALSEAPPTITCLSSQVDFGPSRKYECVLSIASLLRLDMHIERRANLQSLLQWFSSLENMILYLSSDHEGDAEKQCTPELQDAMEDIVTRSSFN
ncbi:uncharacterized protein PHACADRAFT_26618 [Phanerochaete carnosa HHB-10118-sp]|uniref:Uncharacterized protein n=1 Tax=Phanerochaete carnosa (strain HHB-10118-sp) TaxID=650164 RepID=K5V5V7_PHACS|nr:uncharacterized protein PHACADRAFT_26618 [Phanerochaete carnosa HHB-10118-sp]EKM58076.1 hypothetical protein PHACADRAFT_26618 [Phanerochaete carnosa HHB-10118-sp]